MTEQTVWFIVQQWDSDYFFWEDDLVCDHFEEEQNNRSHALQILEKRRTDFPSEKWRLLKITNSRQEEPIND